MTINDGAQTLTFLLFLSSLSFLFLPSPFFSLPSPSWQHNREARQLASLARQLASLARQREEGAAGRCVGTTANGLAEAMHDRRAAAARHGQSGCVRGWQEVRQPARVQIVVAVYGRATTRAAGGDRACRRGSGQGLEGSPLPPYGATPPPPPLNFRI